jgi:hypothetical protein
MKHLLVLTGLLASAAAAHAKEWRPPEEFLRAVRTVESSNGQNKYGDHGESLGDFQLSEAAWLDVNEWRKARSLKTYRYDRSVFNGFINRVYAADYLTILHSELSQKLKRAPTHPELYAAYNLGLSSFAKCGYQVPRVNAATRAKCQQIGMLLASK